MNTFLIDLLNAALLGKSLHATITTNTTTNGAGVDCQLTDGPVHGIYSFADYGDANTQTILKLQESDDNITFSDIDGATVTLAASATANDNIAGVIPAPFRKKQYVRAVAVTSGGGTPSVPVSCCIMGRKKITGVGTGYKP